MVCTIPVFTTTPSSLAPFCCGVMTGGMEGVMVVVDVGGVGGVVVEGVAVEGGRVPVVGGAGSADES